MIPIRLYLSGFLSYLDPVELDFSSFDIACISGSNGAGKSSLLDAITWALFGQARRHDDAIINSHTQTAQIIFDFQYESNTYRIQRSKTRDKTAVLEFFIKVDETQWKPLTERAMRETEARIRSTLRMDYDTFINASFFLQGKADLFAQQPANSRKKVLSSILGLEIWEEYRLATAERLKKIQSDVKGLDGQLKEIDEELSQEDARKKRLADAEADLAHLQELYASKAAVLLNLQRLATSLKEQKRMLDLMERGVKEVRQRHDHMNAQLHELQIAQATYQDVIAQEGEITAQYHRWQELRTTLERLDGVAMNFHEVEMRRAQPLKIITAEESRLMQEQKNLHDQQNLLFLEENHLGKLREQAATLEVQIREVENALASRAQMDEQLQALRQDMADFKAENDAARPTMNLLKERIARLKEAEGAVCPVCGQPLTMQDRDKMIADLQAEGAQMGDHFRENNSKLEECQRQAKQLQEALSGMSGHEGSLRALAAQKARMDGDEARIQQSLTVWREAPITQNGQARLEDITRQLSDRDFAPQAQAQLAAIDAESAALGYDSAAHDGIRKAEQSARPIQEKVRSLEQARAAFDPLQRQVDSLQKEIVKEQSALSSQEENYRKARESYDEQAKDLPDVDKAEQEVLSLQTDANRRRMEVGMVRQQVAVLDSQRERKAKLTGQREGFSLKIARLVSLERAFSKDGVPALLIEQALPEIESEANDVLDHLSGGNMSVHFETQKQYKDKSRDDRRETLDIYISDSVGVREYELFSGGEAFRVNFAIRLALSRVLAQRAGARLQTLVIDEGFGSQDMEGRQRLIEAINQVRPEFAKILVITHLEELKDAFPARIEVEKGLNGSQIKVVA